MFRLYFSKIFILILVIITFQQCINYTQSEKRSAKFIEIAKAYEQIGEYSNALTYYQQAYYLIPKIQWAEKVGSLYLKNHQYKAGLLWFKKQFKKVNVSQPLYATYARLLMYNDEYSSAKRYFEKSTLYIDEKQFYLKSCDSSIYWSTKPNHFHVENLGKVNSQYSDISPAFYQNELVFSSSREGVIIRKRTGGQNQPYYNLYKTKREGNNWLKPSIFSMNLNTFHHEGAMAFSEDFSEIYLTRGGTRMYKQQEVQYLKLYKSVSDGNTWSKPSYFVLNDSTASFGHPCMAFHDEIFLFASDLADGYGGTDLYICFKKEEGWSMPINLGPEINTSKDELYPYLTSNGSLFFSSNGHIGMGGFDLYKSKLVNGEWIPAKNLESPINTSFDDFSLIINDSTNIGYFSSNRLGGKGAEDIYQLEVNPSFFH